MKKLIVKPQFMLLLSEITFLGNLAPNGTATELTGVDKRTIGNIYYKYFGSLEISETLIANEMKEKWPGGERLKTHEAQRRILDVLHKVNNLQPQPDLLIPNPGVVMDLSFLHAMLTQATWSELIILPLVTEVITQVPIVEATHVAVTVNARLVEFPKGSAVRYGDLFQVAYPDTEIVPGLTCTYSYNGGGASLLFDGPGVLPQAGMIFNIISTSNA